MYTLRVIDQTKVGAEERINIFIGSQYSVLMKVNPQEPVKEGTDKFEEALNAYYGLDTPRNPVEVESIVGFVFANGATYPIHNYNVVYIVNNEGQTFERIYGLYQKY